MPSSKAASKSLALVGMIPAIVMNKYGLGITLHAHTDTHMQALVSFDKYCNGTCLTLAHVLD